MALHTERLLLRRWKESDIVPFAAMNADPVVMEFFPKLLTLEETKNLVKSAEEKLESDNWGLWAAEETETGEFIGFIGLAVPRFEAEFTPCVEVGWRLARKFWGKGYAPEGAREVLRDGFERLELAEILSWTAAINKKSIRVMEKIGMSNDPADNFLHPSVAEGHPLQLHVLYRLSKAEWRQRG